MVRMPQHTLAILAAISGGVTAVAMASCSPTPDSPGVQGVSGNPGAGGDAGLAGMPGVSGGGATAMAGAAGAAPVAPVAGSGGVSGAATAGAAGFGASGMGNNPPDGGTGGSAGMGLGGSSGSGTAGSGTAGSAGSGGGGNEMLAKFSFFVTSMQAILQLAGNNDGFGGDLRFGKADGLSGADEICRQTAEKGMPGAGNKQWRAFLSVAGPPVVNARDRIGPGPWYDVRGRLLAENLTGLLGQDRPKGDPEIVDDLPNERGEANQYVGPNGFTAGTRWDNHDFLTGSNADGTLYTATAGGGGFPGGGGGMTGGKNSTCQDWTSKEATSGQPRLGHSWPRSKSTGIGAGFASDHDAKGCTPGWNLDLDNLAGQGTCVGCGGGYGGLYCFALP